MAIKRIKAFVGIIVAILIICLGTMAFLYLNWHGHVPHFSDTNDVAYAKLLGIKPTSGRVWEHSMGFGSGFCFFRLHLSQEDFESSGISKYNTLPRINPKPKTPIWWNPRTNDSQYFSGPGLGDGTTNIYVYDKRRCLLFARCEWD